MTETIAAYVRVSTEQQKEEGSHESQRESIELWADRNDADHVEFFEDLAISGQSENREAYSELMDCYDQYDAVVVRELSRFGRDPLTVMEDIEAITESDTEFISVTESFDTSSAMGKAFVRLLAVINGMYADLRREQAIRAAERRRERGEPVGRPPKLNPDQQQYVFDLRDKGLSYSAIATLVEDEFDVSISRSTIKRYCDDRDEDE
jgi:DNA invertase Pin-like site-specific DNA recombinase